MTVRELGHAERAGGRWSFPGRGGQPPWPGTLLQWAAVLAAGLLLGGTALAASLLSPRLAAILVLAALSPFVAMAIGNLRRALLAILLLDLPLQLDVYLGYRAEIGNLGGVGGWSISLTTVALVALYLIWLSGLLTRAAPLPRPALGQSWGLLLFLALAFLSLLVARDSVLASYSLLLWAQMFLVFLYIASTTRSRADLRFIVMVLLAGLALESAIILLQRAAGASDAMFGGRATGTLATPNNAASYLGQGMTIAAAVLLTGADRWHKRLAGLAFGLGLAALILTFSRGGWLAFGVAMLALCLPALLRGWLPPLLPLSVALLATPLALAFREPILARLGQGDNGRTPLVEMALAIIRDHPLLGVGANNYVLYIPEYATPAYGGVWLYAVHNTYLLLWAELGPLALVTIALFLAAAARRGWRCWRSEDRLLAPLGLGLGAGIVAFMTHMQLDLFHGRGLWQLILVNAALITAIERIQRRERAVAGAAA